MEYEQSFYCQMCENWGVLKYPSLVCTECSATLSNYSWEEGTDDNNVVLIGRLEEVE